MKALPKILKKQNSARDNSLPENSVKKSLCLNRFILQTCPHGKLPTCDYFVIFFF